MSSTPRLVLLAMTLALSACVAAKTTNISASGTSRVPPLPPGANVPTWEHYCTLFDHGKGYYEVVASLIAEAGENGWEMVSAGDSDAGLLICFKRPTPAPAPASSLVP